MVLPISTKPGYHQQLKRVYPNSWYARVVWYDSVGTRYSQTPPWDRPLPYTRQQFWELNASCSGGGIVPDLEYVVPTNHGNMVNLSYERAFTKLSNSTRGGQERGDVGITIAQSHLTYKLYKEYLQKFVYMKKLGDICATLDRFAVFTRRAADAGNRRARQRYRNKAARVLGVRPATDREVRRRLDGQLLRTGVSSFSAEYLAVHYGWSPLFKEIHTALVFLSEGINYPSGWYQESGSCYTNTKERRGSVDYHITCRVSTKLGCKAEVENELLYCLGVMGLANPAAVAWDAVKWSFVVDWVLSIGPRLQNQTAFLGIKFSETFRTTYTDVEFRRSVSSGSVSYSQTGQGYNVVRQIGVGFLPPPIRVKNPIGKDFGKALAQVSLLAMFGLKPNSRT